jgi:hypothetical protein
MYHYCDFESFCVGLVELSFAVFMLSISYFTVVMANHIFH